MVKRHAQVVKPHNLDTSTGHFMLECRRPFVESYHMHHSFKKDTVLVVVRHEVALDERSARWRV
jgi:hypothetical protein